MHDSHYNRIGYEFVDYETTTPIINDQVSKFVKTGKCEFVNEEEFKKSISTGQERVSKLGNTLLFRPRDFMGGLHKRTHFKAGETVQHATKQGQSLFVRPDEHYSRFQEISRNVEPYMM